jgi:hypothetical protein
MRASRSSLDVRVKSGSQIWRTLPQLGFQYRFSSQHIVVGRLRTVFGWPVSELPTFAVAFLPRTAKYLRYRIFRRPPYCKLDYGSSQCYFQPRGLIGIRVVAKSAGSTNLILLYTYGCTTHGAVVLKRSIFRRKKGIANLSLGLF